MKAGPYLGPALALFAEVARRPMIEARVSIQAMVAKDGTVREIRSLEVGEEK